MLVKASARLCHNVPPQSCFDGATYHEEKRAHSVPREKEATTR